MYELLYGLGSTGIATDFGRERKKKILDSSIPIAGGEWTKSLNFQPISLGKQHKSNCQPKGLLHIGSGITKTG